MRMLVCATGLILGACIVQPAPATRTTAGPPPPEEEVVVRDHREPAPAPASGDIVRAKEIRAGFVRARVIYAKEVKARSGSVGRVYEDRETEEWERGRTDDKIEVDELYADVIYAKEIEADVVEADEIYAKEVKIGR